MPLFLDANAHVPLNNKALEAFIGFNKSIGGHGNAMAASLPGRTSAAEIETAREIIAEKIGAQNRNQIIFTSSCTQACEWALDLLYQKGFKKVYCSQVEHSAVNKKAREFFGNNDLFVSREGVTACSFVPDPNSAFICIHVQNEIGTIQSIEDIKVPFFSDMSQSLGKIPINVSKIKNLHLATFGAHKFGGPVGTGFLYIQDTTWWKEFGSGSRYFFDRSGTPDAANIVATAAALKDAISTLPKRYEQALNFKATLENSVHSLGFNIIGENSTRIPHTTFIQIGKGMGPYIMSQLEAEGIYIGLGSACGSFNTGANPLMSALGYGGKSSDYIRISQWGDYGATEAKMVVKVLAQNCPKLNKIP
ncbi:MAG: aminotransferase class V-fold PLP-dependent enzyme [Clostridia bacterium]|jgi:cysteine sulfinate desulfinase/cysteine desulfurase-like protein